MARGKGTANLAASLEVLAGAPLDARTVVNTIADLTDPASFPYSYIGLPVYVVSEEKIYTLKSDDTTKIENWKVIGADVEIPEFDNGKYIKVDELPESGEGKNVYLLKNGDNYDQYVWDENEHDWINLNSSTAIDLEGYVTEDDLNTTLTNYATKEDLENIDLDVDTTIFATKSELETELENYYPKTETYTKTEIDEKIDAIPSSGTGTDVDLTDYYTKTEVDELIEGIDIPSGSETDLSNYYNKSEVDTALENKANVSDIPTDFYTKSEVDEKIDAIEIPEIPEIPDPIDAYTKTETDALLGDKANTADVYSKSEIDTALESKADVDTTYTKTEVDELISSIPSGGGESVDLNDYYTAEDIDLMLQGNITESKMPNIIEDLEDVFEGISPPVAVDENVITNVGVITNFDEENGNPTYRGRNVQMEENVDVDAEIANILNALNEGE